MDADGSVSAGVRPAKKYARLLDPTNLILTFTILAALFFLVTYARLNVSLREENAQLRESAAKMSQAEAGDAVPSFETTDLEGRPAGVSYRTPQRHLLFIFTLHCGACADELPAWDRLAAEFGGKGLDVRAVSLDAPDEAKAGMDGRVKSLSTIMAPDKNFVRTYRVYGFPQVMLISEQGVVEWVHVGKLSEENLKELTEKLTRPSA